jgi:hypothetical protein
MDTQQDYRELADWYRSSAALESTRSARRECVEMAELMDEMAAEQERVATLQ